MKDLKKLVRDAVNEVLLERAPECSSKTTPTYSYLDIEMRIAELNKGGIVLSNQYGMVFLLNKNNEIVLNISGLLTREERLKHS